MLIQQNKFYSQPAGVSLGSATPAGWLYFRCRCGRCSTSIHPDQLTLLLFRSRVKVRLDFVLGGYVLACITSAVFPKFYSDELSMW